MKTLLNKWIFCLIVGLALLVAAGENTTANTSEKKPGTVIHAMPRSPGSEIKDEAKDSVSGQKPVTEAQAKQARMDADSMAAVTQAQTEQKGETALEGETAPAGETVPLGEETRKGDASQQAHKEAALDPVSSDPAETGSEEPADENKRYAAKSRLDPFMPLLQEKTAPSVKIQKPEKPQRILTPLEKMELSQIKLVAVVMTDTRKIAMVEEATGKGYEVKIGTYMGKNGGQVVDIGFDSIVVKEIVTDFKGSQTERFQEIKLHKPDNGE